jgi:hypothetical protein
VYIVSTFIAYENNSHNPYDYTEISGSSVSREMQTRSREFESRQTPRGTSLRRYKVHTDSTASLHCHVSLCERAVEAEYLKGRVNFGALM